MSKNVGKIISKHLSSKYSQTFLDHAKQSSADALKTVSKRPIQKTAEATGDLIGNKIVNKITRFSKPSPKNDLEANKERILREIYIQELILNINDDLILNYETSDDLRLI